MQAVFVSGYLPRDAYQQEAFTQAVAVEAMLPGDLVFLISPESNSCGTLFREGFYIHSSGQRWVAIKLRLTSFRNREISRSYYWQLRSWESHSVTNRRAAEDKEISRSRKLNPAREEERFMIVFGTGDSGASSAFIEPQIKLHFDYIEGELIIASGSQARNSPPPISK